MVYAWASKDKSPRPAIKTPIVIKPILNVNKLEGNGFLKIETNLTIKRDSNFKSITI